MSSQWYYAHNGKTLGPISGDALRELSQQGGLSPTDLVWRDGMVDWAPAATIGLASSVSPLPPPFPPTTRSATAPALPPWTATQANPPRTTRLPIPVHSQTMFVWGAILLAVVVVAGSWLVFGLRLRAPAPSKIAQRVERPPRKTASMTKNNSRLSGAAPSGAALSPTAVSHAVPDAPLSKPADDSTDRELVSKQTPVTPPSEPNLAPAPTVAPTSVDQPPASQPVPPATPAAAARRTMFQQVDIQRRPQFSMQGFETVQNIHYQLLSRLDVEPEVGGRRQVVQYVQETRLLAADDLSRDAFTKSLERLKGQQYIYVLNDRGEVIEFTGHKDNLQTLPVELPSASGFAVTSVIDEDGWKELAELTFLVPDRQTTAKQSWRRQMTHDWGLLGSWYGMTTFVRGKEINGSQEIQYSHQMTYVKPVAAAGTLPFRIVDARFEPQQAGGRIEFDSQRQQVRLAQEVFDVRGTVAVELLGQAIEIQLAEQQRIELHITDRP